MSPKSPKQFRFRNYDGSFAQILWIHRTAETATSLAFRRLVQAAPNRTSPPVAAESSFLIPGPVPFFCSRAPGLSFCCFLYVCWVTFEFSVMFLTWFKTRQLFLEPLLFWAAFILIPQFGASKQQSVPFICLRSDAPGKKSKKNTPTQRCTKYAAK